MFWAVIFRDRDTIISEEFDAAISFPSTGLSVQPFSTTAHESVLTINGTEHNNGVRVQCSAYNLAKPFILCPSRKVSVIFYQPGMKLTFVCIKLTFVCDELTCWCDYCDGDLCVCMCVICLY